MLVDLKTATTLKDVAEILGFSTKGLSFFLYALNPSARYRSFEIPKKGGGARTIHAPVDGLKLIQRRLAKVLQECNEWMVAAEGKARRPLYHGFTPERSIFTNASVHRRQEFVFNVDIEDFFGSINFGRVRGYFISNKYFKLDPAVATVLAQIACHDSTAEGKQQGHNSRLPQGSPCSPIISNLIGGMLDVRLVGLAKLHGCRYSRYADDLTFSTSKSPFPTEIARQIGNAHQWAPGSSLSNLIEDSGFKLNPKKTRMQYCSSRQEVTGLVVNSIANTRPEYRRQVRAMVDSLTRTGKYTIDDVEYGQEKLNQLAGRLGFVSHIDIQRQKVKQTERRKELSSRDKVYQQFLFFRHFYAADLPVIVTEGKTDVIYLKFAFQALAKKFPQLYSRTVDDKFEQHVHIFAHGDRHRNQLLGFRSGGTGDLTNFMRTYFRVAKDFKAPSKKAPIILVVDRDDGFSAVRNTIKDLQNGRKPDENAPFYELDLNVYIVPIPLEGSPKRAIEDLFDSDTRETRLSGKRLELNEKEFDSTQHYSKHVFATEVILKNHQNIRFDGFAPLLQRIAEVVDLSKPKAG